MFSASEIKLPLKERLLRRSPKIRRVNAFPRMALYNFGKAPDRSFDSYRQYERYKQTVRQRVLLLERTAGVAPPWPFCLFFHCLDVC